MKKLLAAAVFLLAAVALLWKPVFFDMALLPGDYLQQMQPWSSPGQPEPQAQWNPLSWDAIAQFYPWRVFLGRSLSQGVLPLWNPHQFCGNPFLANGQSAVLYPPNWIFAVCEPVRALTYLAIFHLTLAGIFCYLLLRRFNISRAASVFGALVFELCAFNIYWLELATLVCASAWMPGAAWALHRAIVGKSRKHFLFTAIALAMPVLAGHLQIAFYVWFIAAAWAIYLLAVTGIENRRFPTVAVTGAVIAVVIGLMIASGQVLPSLELQRNSHRSQQADAEGYRGFVSHGVPSYRFVTSIMPNYFGNPNRGNYLLLGHIGDRFNMPADHIEFGMYVGVSGLLMAIVGVFGWRKCRYLRFWTVTALVTLLLAAGSFLNAPLYFAVPGFAALGGPHRILLIYMLALAVLSGFGVDYVTAKSERKFKLFGRELPGRVLAAGAAVLLMCIAAGVSISLADGASKALPEQIYAALEAVQAGAVLRYAGFMLVSCALLFLGAGGVLKGRYFAGAAVVLLAVELVGHGWMSIPMCERSAVYPKTELTDYLVAHSGRRVLPANTSWSLTALPESILPPNAAMVYGYYDVQGYDSLYTEDYKKHLQNLFGVDPCPPENGNMILGRNTVPNDLGLRVSSADKAYPHILEDFGGIMVSDSEDNRAGWIASVGSELANVRFPTANTVEIDIPPASDADIKLRVLPYPGWKEIGASEGIRAEDVQMRLPANNRSQVSLVFQPDSFRVGIFLTIAGLAACIGILAFIRFNQR